MKVSVFMITYNHEKYIAQAIESVLMQKVDFDYELVIGEDCSRDGTRSIVLDYQKRHPGRIRTLLSETNVGAARNAIRTWQACDGDYIAVLEGDDYWTSPDKLQKQVDFLESHRDCALCFHNVNVVYADDSRTPHCHCQPNQPEISTIEDLLVSNFIPACSTMYRRLDVIGFPDWFTTVKMGDWFVTVHHAQRGKVGYLDEVLAAYRVHRGGVWSRLSDTQILVANIEFYQKINPYLQFKYDAIIRPQEAKCWQDLADIVVQRGIDRGLASTSPGDRLDLFDNWPVNVPYTTAWRNGILKRVYAALLFENYKARHLQKTRYYWLKTVRHDPSWLRNRSVWSIGARSMVGRIA